MEKSSSVGIVLENTVLRMLKAVQFNDKLCLMAIKISNIIAKNFLAAETGRTINVVPPVSYPGGVCAHLEGYSCFWD